MPFCKSKKSIITHCAKMSHRVQKKIKTFIRLKKLIMAKIALFGCFWGLFLTLGQGTSGARNENLRPLFNTNIPPISGKSGLRTHFQPLESGVLALGSEEKCFFSAGCRQKILFFSQSGPSISVLRVPEEKLAVHNFLG